MSRNSTENLAEELSSYGIKAVAYHAGLPPVQREKAQDDFINDRVNVVCATVAFGMGIDKSNVRWVVHYNMPEVSRTTTEIGRAGRDGMKSDTLLFYSVGDLLVLRRFAEESGQKRHQPPETEPHAPLLRSGTSAAGVSSSVTSEKKATRTAATVMYAKNSPQRFDGSILVQKALSAIFRTGEFVGMNMLINILRGSEKTEITEKGYDKLKTYGAGKDLSYKEWKEYLYQMLQLGYIEIDYVNAGILKVTPLGRKVLFGEQKAMMAIYKEPEEKTYFRRKDSKFKYRPIKPIQSASVEETLLDSLQQLRKQIAEREQTPAYIIFSDDSLEDMVQKKACYPGRVQRNTWCGEKSNWKNTERYSWH